MLTLSSTVGCGKSVLSCYLTSTVTSTVCKSFHVFKELNNLGKFLYSAEKVRNCLT